MTVGDVYRLQLLSCPGLAWSMSIKHTQVTIANKLCDVCVGGGMVMKFQGKMEDLGEPVF